MLLDDETAYRLLCAKYSPNRLPVKITGMNALCRVVFENFSTGRYSAKRGRKYIADLVAYVCMPEKARKSGSVMAISKRHGIAHDLISRDIDRIKKIIYRHEAMVIAKIEDIFARSGIIPEKSCFH
jgi:hypothetical protein